MLAPFYAWPVPALARSAFARSLVARLVLPGKPKSRDFPTIAGRLPGLQAAVLPGYLHAIVSSVVHGPASHLDQMFRRLASHRLRTLVIYVRIAARSRLLLV